MEGLKEYRSSKKEKSQFYGNEKPERQFEYEQDTWLAFFEFKIKSQQAIFDLCVLVVIAVVLVVYDRQSSFYNQTVFKGILAFTIFLIFHQLYRHWYQYRKQKINDRKYRESNNLSQAKYQYRSNQPQFSSSNNSPSPSKQNTIRLQSLGSFSELESSEISMERSSIKHLNSSSDIMKTSFHHEKLNNRQSNKINFSNQKQQDEGKDYNPTSPGTPYGLTSPYSQIPASPINKNRNRYSHIDKFQLDDTNNNLHQNFYDRKDSDFLGNHDKREEIIRNKGKKQSYNTGKYFKSIFSFFKDDYKQEQREFQIKVANYFLEIDNPFTEKGKSDSSNDVEAINQKFWESVKDRSSKFINTFKKNTETYLYNNIIQNVYRWQIENLIKLNEFLIENFNKKLEELDILNEGDMLINESHKIDHKILSLLSNWFNVHQNSVRNITLDQLIAYYSTCQNRGILVWQTSSLQLNSQDVHKQLFSLVEERLNLDEYITLTGYDKSTNRLHVLKRLGQLSCYGPRSFRYHDQNLPQKFASDSEIVAFVFVRQYNRIHPRSQNEFQGKI